MKESTYNSYLLYTYKDGLGIISLQTNNTLFVGDKMFTLAKEINLKST